MIVSLKYSLTNVSSITTTSPSHGAIIFPSSMIISLFGCLKKNKTNKKKRTEAASNNIENNEKKSINRLRRLFIIIKKINTTISELYPSL